jgi:hypothetical protein
MSAFDISLRIQLARYLTGEISLPEFRRWFLPTIWDLAEDDQLLSPLARRVELRLAEYSNGHWTEDDLKHLFERATPITGSLGAPFDPVFSGVIRVVPAERPAPARSAFVATV